MHVWIPWLGYRLVCWNYDLMLLFVQYHHHPRLPLQLRKPLNQPSWRRTTAAGSGLPVPTLPRLWRPWWGRVSILPKDWSGVLIWWAEIWITPVGSQSPNAAHPQSLKQWPGSSWREFTSYTVYWLRAVGSRDRDNGDVRLVLCCWAMVRSCSSWFSEVVGGDLSYLILASPSPFFPVDHGLVAIVKSFCHPGRAAPMALLDTKWRLHSGKKSVHFLWWKISLFYWAFSSWNQ